MTDTIEFVRDGVPVQVGEQVDYLTPTGETASATVATKQSPSTLLRAKDAAGQTVVLAWDSGQWREQELAGG